MQFCKSAKAQERAFLDSLSDLEKDSMDSDSSTSSDDESKRKINDNMNGLCFHVDTTEGGLCTMALDNEVVSGDSKAHNNDSRSEVSLCADELTAKVNSLNATLLS